MKEVKESMKVEKITEVVAELKAIAEALAAKDPIAEEVSELESLGDKSLIPDIMKVLKPAMAKLEEISKEIAEFMKQEPKHTDEAVAALEAKIVTLEAGVAEGQKAVAELAEIKAKASFESRVKELTDAGLYLETEAEVIKTLTDEKFVEYKAKMVSLKASFVDQAKKDEETVKATAEAEKVKAEADKKAKETAVASLNTETKIEQKDLRKLYAELI